MLERLLEQNMPLTNPKNFIYGIAIKNLMKIRPLGDPKDIASFLEREIANSRGRFWSFYIGLVKDLRDSSDDEKAKEVYQRLLDKYK